MATLAYFWVLHCLIISYYDSMVYRLIIYFLFIIYFLLCYYIFYYRYVFLNDEDLYFQTYLNFLQYIEECIFDCNIICIYIYIS